MVNVPKLLVRIGTRPEVIKMSQFILAAKRDPSIECLVCANPAAKARKNFQEKS
jgi:UDP-N-acetylglucosamine 2-epimerase